MSSRSISEASVPLSEQSPKAQCDLWRWALSSAGSLFVLCFVLLLPMLRCEFRHDDFTWLAFARSWNSGASLWHSPTGLTTLWNAIFLAIYHVAAFHPAPYYVAMAVMHALATCGVLWAAYELTRERLTAFLTALFFGLFWQHHEAVTWIAVGYRPLAMLCIMLCVASYARARRDASLRWLVVSAIAALAALLAKEDALSLLFALPLVSLLVARPKTAQTRRFLKIEYSIAALVALIYVALQFMVGNRHGAVTVGAQMYSLGPHVLTNIVFCVPQMLLPDLGFVTYRDFLAHLGVSAAMRETLHSATHFAGALLSLVALIAVWKGAARVRFCVLWCYVMFLPFAPFTAEFARAPRYLYTGTFGLMLLAGWCAASWIERTQRIPRRTAQMGLVCSVIALLLLSNVAFLLLIQKNRQRDSRVRRAIATQTTQLVAPLLPLHGKNARVVLLGVPNDMIDLADGLALQMNVPVKAEADETKSRASNLYVVRIGGAPNYAAQLVASPKTKP